MVHKAALQALAEPRKELESIDTDGIKVLLGAEGEYADFLLGLGEDGAQYTDYIIVPHSHTHMKGFVISEECANDPEKHANHLVRSFISLCGHKKRHLFFGIAHPMAPIGAHPDCIEKIYSHITDTMLNECANAAKEANVALEANLSVLKSIPPDRGENFCMRRFFDACRRAGCEFFMGSDAHRIDTFLSRHGEQSALIKLIGLCESDFTAAEHRIPNV